MERTTAAAMVAVNKFLIAIAGIVAVMATLVFLPGLGNFSARPAESPATTTTSPDAPFELEYSRQHLTKRDDGTFAAASASVLTVQDDGSATYYKIAGSGNEGGGKGEEKMAFSLSREEVSSLKGLVFGTGFMQIPDSAAGRLQTTKEGLANFTKYTFKVSTYDGGARATKTVGWVDPEAYGGQGAVPSLVTNIGHQLDQIIAKRA